jgi:hypothetical protein
MFREFLIGDAVCRELFFAVAAQDADHRGLLAFVVENAFDAEAGCAFLHVGLVAPGEIASGETQIVQRVEQVRFAYAVVATDTHDPLVKAEAGLFIVLELNERYFIYA